MREQNCVVVGGGLGGLSVALSLAQNGHSVRLLEQAPMIEPIGYGIQLGPNVIPIFQSYGIAEDIIANSHLPSAIAMLDAGSARTIAEISLGAEFRSRFTYPYICIHRGAIHAIMLKACEANPSIRLEKGVRVTGYRQAADKAIAHTEDHGDIEGDMLIGADGINSRIRGQMHPANPLQPIGYVAHRTIVPFDQVPDGIRQDPVTMFAGDGYHVIFYPLPNNIGMNFVGVFSFGLEGHAAGHEPRRRQILERCRDANPEVLKVLECMNFECRWELADRKPVRRWSEGRTVLLGDSAHPTFQSLAQGACMAIEDAVVLADCVTSRDSVAEGFKAYENRRLTRTARVQLESRDLWTTYHVGDIAAQVRDMQFESRTASDYYNCLDWLWSPLGEAKR